MNWVMLVDDDRVVLSTLRRELTELGNRYVFIFCDSAAEALERLQERPVDMLISDLSMPQMGGSELLSVVSKKYPQTIRAIVAETTDLEAALRSIKHAHQFFTKPIAGQELVRRIEQAFEWHDTLHNGEVAKLVNSLEKLPALPRVYQDMMTEMQQQNASMRKVAEIIEQDGGIAAKILQLINSAYFGIGRDVTSIFETANLLGFDILQALVLSSSLAGQFPPDIDRYEDSEKLWAHGFETARLSKALAKRLTNRSSLADTAYCAGLLHDIGRLILATNYRQDYADVRDWARTHKVQLPLVEIAHFGCNHGDVAAYLLGVWGLPYALVQAVAHHHDPTIDRHIDCPAIGIVHIANALAHGDQARATVDEPFLELVGLTDSFSDWCDELPR
ncbi:MAG: HD-like signal output (HDOD) protein [Gammaproteobacteria bacterium]|jgi:HD-like signal output (HDOD) protein